MSGEILVVGAGPAGLATALALRAHGLSARVLEERGPSDGITGGRALFVHHDSLALLEVVSPGLGQAIGAAGIRWARRETRYAGRVVYARDEKQAPLRDGLPAYTSLRQADTVDFLLDACKRSGIDVEWSTKVQAVTSGQDGVTLTTDSGEAHADFVIGADGARSIVRDSLGIALEGPRLPSYHLVVDIGETQRTTRTLHYSCPELDGRCVLYVPFAGGYQIDVQCRDEADVERLAQTRSWIPPGDVERVAWVSRYRFIRAVAASFVDARRQVLLVGESAHLFPPFGARGMNSSFADAVAAATAIAFATSVKSTAAIAHYESERRGAALVNADTAYHAYRHLHPSLSMRAAQWGAAKAAPVVPGAGRWLEHSAYGPRVRTGGRY
jgi:3-(3-hydroxy-phenyl)propionate hydroxylase